MVELGTRWTFEPGDRLSMMDAVNASDASGEAGSQRGCSDLEPPGMCVGP